MIRRMKKNDINDTTAALVYDTDPDLFPFLFGSPQKGLPRLKRLMALGHNCFSHRLGWVDEQNGKLRGLLMAYAPSGINESKEAVDFNRVFKGPMLYWHQLKAWIVSQFTDKKSMGDYYIQNICVDAQHRGQGIGSALLKSCLAQCQAKGMKQVTLDVSLVNEGAYRLYKRLGFQHLKTIRVPLLGDQAHRLQLSL